VNGLSGVVEIAATGDAGGSNHSLARLGDGTVRSWGLNTWGQLGDGTATTRTTPVVVSGLSGVIAIAGARHSLAIVPPSADLAITKSDSPDPVPTDSELTYTLTVANNGPLPATGVIVTDTLPASVTLVSAPGCTGSGTLACPVAELAVGASATLAIVVRASTAGTITNTATVAANETDSVAANNTATSTTTVTAAQADLVVTKDDSPDPVYVGTSLSYTITVRNNGPSPATAVTLTDSLPVSFSFVSASTSQGGCTGGGTLTCNLGSLANGATATVVLVVTPTSAGSVSNTACATAAEQDPSVLNHCYVATTTINHSADLFVTESDSPDPVLLGGNVTYTLTAGNNGPSPSNFGVIVNDTLPGGFTLVSLTPSAGTCTTVPISCNVGVLASGATATVTIVATPNFVGTFTNTATIANPSNDPNLGNNAASQTTTISPVVNVSVSIADAPNPVSVGANLTYTLIVQNTGSSSATGVTVINTLPAGVTLVSATATQGTCTGAGPITCALGTIGLANIIIVVTPTVPGTITNIATATANEFDSDPSNNSASATTTVNAVADLSLTKSDAPDPVLLGGNLTYSMTVSNNGPSPATGVTVVDTLPAGVTLISATPTQGTCSGVGTLNCALGNLVMGASAGVTIVVSPGGSGTITNTAVVSANEIDTNAANNTATASTVVNPVADLEISKSDSPDPALVGAPLTYTITVINHGPSQATGVIVSDTPPDGVGGFSVSASQGPGCPGPGVSCHLGTLASGSSATMTFVVTPSTAGTKTNVATVSANEADPDAGNNTATATTTVNAQADLSVTKSDSPDPVFVGADLDYTINVTNSGPSPATGVTLTDTLPASVTLVGFAAQGTATCTGTMTLTCDLGTLPAGNTSSVYVTIRPNSAGTLINTVTVAANETDPVSGNNTTTVSTTVNGSANLSITKSDSPDPVLAGANLTYVLTVSNAGPSPATGVTVTDTLPAGVTFISSSAGCSGTSTVTCAVGNLAVGGSASANIVVRPSAAGSITNTATIGGNEPDSDNADNTAVQTTSVSPAADLAVAKVDSPDPVIVTMPLTYNISVTNIGPSVATAVTVTDALPVGVALVSATPSQGTCSASSNLVCALGTMAVGATGSVTVVVMPTVLGLVSNTATVTAEQIDPVPGNNSSTQGSTVNPPPDLMGPITSDVVVTPNPEEINLPTTITATVDDSATGASSIATAEYRIDGGPFTPMNASDGGFNAVMEGVVSGPLSFAAPGVHEVCVRGRDVFGNYGPLTCVFLAIYDPDGGFVTGGGWIQSPLGAYAANAGLTGRANFGFVSKYLPGANVPSGETQFQFKTADLNFHSTSYEWLVVAGARAQFKGSGTINGTGDYSFQLTGIDGQRPGGGGTDRFRIKIMNKGSGGVIYDNQMDKGDNGNDATELGGGSIVIHN
jgi:uncharacterized repeat protein (TIGR01451 family)